MHFVTFVTEANRASGGCFRDARQQEHLMFVSLEPTGDIWYRRLFFTVDGQYFPWKAENGNYYPDYIRSKCDVPSPGPVEHTYDIIVGTLNEIVRSYAQRLTALPFESDLVYEDVNPYTAMEG